MSPARSVLVLLLLVLSAACSGSGGGDGDTDGGSSAIDGGQGDVDAAGDAAVPADCDAHLVIGDFSLGIHNPDFPSFSGRFLDHPEPRMLAVLAEEGGCKLYGPSPAFCDPPCDQGICDVDGVCQTPPVAIDIGDLRLTGNNVDITITVRPGNNYYFTEQHAELYQPGEIMQLHLEEGAAPAAILEAEVVRYLDGNWDGLQAVEHEPMTVTWDTEGAKADSVVILHMDSDHHGTAAYVECYFTDTAGTGTVPAAIIDELIEMGRTGIGTYIENSWIARTLFNYDSGTGTCLSFRSDSSRFVFVETVLAE